MKLTDLGSGDYIALETFKRNGEGVITPVWVVGDGGQLLVWTQADSWKVKRIRNNSRVRVCQSDMRGTPTGPWLDAQARVLNDAAEESAQQKRLKAKYGAKVLMFTLMRRLRGKKMPARVVVEITPAT